MNKYSQTLLKYLSYLGKVSIFFVVYFAAARFGLGISPVSGFATLVWPPTGIALATLLIFGLELWPAVLAGAFLVNYLSGASWPVALGIGTGNMLEALVGAYLLKSQGFKNNLGRLRDVLLLLGPVALLSTMISATIGTASLFFGGLVPFFFFVDTWLAWWIGDMLGALIIAPLLLLWLGNRNYTRLKPERYAELAAIAAIIASITIFVFDGFDISVIIPYFGNSVFLYLIFPPLLWTAIRFGQREVNFFICGISAYAIYSTLLGFGPFMGDEISENLLKLQLFMGVLAVTSMIMAAVVNEREEAEKAVREVNENLEKKVKERTFALRRAQEIINKSFEGVMIANGTQEHLIQYVNPAWEHTTGWTKDEVVGKEAPRILKSGKTSPEFYKKLWSTILGGNLFSAEITNKRKDGTFYEAEINIFPITDEDNVHYYVEISRDITEHKKMEAQLAEYTKGLETMVADRTKELEEKVGDLEKLNKFMVGRELRMIELKEEIDRLGIGLKQLKLKPEAPAGRVKRKTAKK